MKRMDHVLLRVVITNNKQFEEEEEEEEVLEAITDLSCKCRACIFRCIIPS